LSSTSSTTIIQIKTFRPEGENNSLLPGGKEGSQAAEEENLGSFKKSSTVISFW